MKNNQIKEKLKEKTIKYINYFLLFVAITLVYTLVKNINRIRSSNIRIEDAQKKVEEARQKNEELKAQLEAVESEYFTESQLRNKLGLAKEGEIVIVLPDDEILRKLAPKTQEEETSLPDPNWKKWLKLFI